MLSFKEKIEWYLSDEYWEDSDFMEDLKTKMCGLNKFGNFFAPFWESTKCTCCAFFRGIVFGATIVGLPLAGVIVWVMN